MTEEKPGNSARMTFGRSTTRTVAATRSQGLAWTVDPSSVQRPKEDATIPSKGYEGYPPLTVSRNRSFIRASHDDGRTWGAIYPLDSDQYPGRVSGVGGFSAAHGHLVVAYSTD